MHHRSIFALGIALVASSCDAKQAEAAPVAAATSPAANASAAPAELTAGMTAPAQAWVSGVRDKMPAALCEQPYFKACFVFAPGECERTVLAQFDGCVRTHRDQVPSAPNVQNGTAAGQILGECTGTGVEVVLTDAGKITKSAQCDAERAKLGGAKP